MGRKHADATRITIHAYAKAVARGKAGDKAAAARYERQAAFLEEQAAGHREAAKEARRRALDDDGADRPEDAEVERELAAIAEANAADCDRAAIADYSRAEDCRESVRAWDAGLKDWLTTGGRKKNSADSDLTR